MLPAFEDMTQSVGASLLVILVVGGNYLAPTFNCGLQRSLEDSMLLKHVFLVLMIMFTLSFTSADPGASPMIQIAHTAVLYGMYLLVSSMDIFYVSCAVTLLVVLYLANKYVSFYKSQGKEKNVENVRKVQKLVMSLLVITVCIGVTVYFLRQRREHKDFSMVKFIFGTVKCAHSKQDCCFPCVT